MLLQRRFMPDLLWPLLALLAVAMSRLTDLDWQISSSFYDAGLQTFPAREAWVWRVFGHQATKQLGMLLWLGLAVVAWRSWRQRDPERLLPLLFVLLTSLLAVSVNGWLKSHSAHSCPWALEGLGGHADYFRILSELPLNPGPGRCIPSGHAGVGFMWIAAIHACRRWHPAWHLRVTLLVLGYGVLCGGIQIVRGAHFPSHVLMSAAVCGAVVMFSDRLPLWSWLARRLAHPHPDLASRRLLLGN